MLIAAFVYSQDLSPEIVKNGHFKQLLRYLVPSFIAPTVNTIESHVDIFYNDIHEEVNKVFVCRVCLCVMCGVRVSICWTGMSMSCCAYRYG